MRLASTLVVAVIIAGYAGARVPASTESVRVAASGSCESLATLALPHATIDATQNVAAGGFVAPAAAAGRGAAATAAAAAFAKAPAFCRVSATLTPSTDSDIKAEVWLPASGWNGKYQAVGGGGWAGAISYLGHGRGRVSRLRNREHRHGTYRRHG